VDEALDFYIEVADLIRGRFCEVAAVEAMNTPLASVIASAARNCATAS
jgi:hypothetical protein